MKFILYLMFFLISLQAAEVDKRFFANDTKQTFVEEVQKHIDTNPNKDLALLESTLLSKIKQADLQEPTVPFEKVSVKYHFRLCHENQDHSAVLYCVPLG